MLPKRLLHSAFPGNTFAAIGCSDDGALGITEGPSQPAFLISSGVERKDERIGTEVGNGKRRAYHAVIDHSKRESELTTLSGFEGWEIICEDEWVSDGIDGETQFIPSDETDSPVFRCPPVVHANSPDFTLISWRGHQFVTVGNFIKQSDLPYTGIPKARYALPIGPWESTDDMAVIWNGTIDGRCFTRPSTRSPSGYSGLIIWYNFQGNAKEFTSGGGGGGGEDPDVDAENDGGSGDAEQAITNLLEGGECTEDWVIYVDGVRVC